MLEVPKGVANDRMDKAAATEYDPPPLSATLRLPAKDRSANGRMLYCELKDWWRRTQTHAKGYG